MQQTNKHALIVRPPWSQDDPELNRLAPLLEASSSLQQHFGQLFRRIEYHDLRACRTNNAVARGGCRRKADNGCNAPNLMFNSVMTCSP